MTISVQSWVSPKTSRILARDLIHCFDEEAVMKQAGLFGL